MREQYKSIWLVKYWLMISTYREPGYWSIGLYIAGRNFNFSTTYYGAEPVEPGIKYTDDLRDYPVQE